MAPTIGVVSNFRPVGSGTVSLPSIWLKWNFRGKHFEPGETMSDHQPGKILIVDDDPSMIRTMTEALQPHGYEIISAPDGNQGLACIEFFKPQLVLLDMMMPKRSGLLVLEGMREMEVYIPAIMVTGNEGTRHRDYANIISVDAYLTKPIRVELLVRTVKRVLESSEREKTS